MKLFEIKKQPPAWELLTEAAADKATHLEHLEDEIFNKGYNGALEAFNYIQGLYSMLTKNGTGDSTKVTVKWDGSPAIHCGIDPEDGKFFIGTKSVFARDAKLCKKESDIDTWYGTSPGLAAILKTCLKNLPKLGITDVIKGDLLFVRGDAERGLKTADINGVEYLTFTPNTITYAIDPTTQIAREMQAAELGIIFHTVYKWEPPSAEAQAERKEQGLEPLKDYANLPDMKATFRFNSAALQKNPAVWWDDAYYEDLTGIATLTPAEAAHVDAAMNKVASTLMKIDPRQFDRMLSDDKAQDFSGYIKPFINVKVREGKFQVGSTTKFLQEFIAYVTEKMNADISKLKGGPDSPAAQERHKRIQELNKFIADNSNTLLGILALYKRAIDLKLFFIKKLQKIESTVGTFIKTDTGYRVSKPEGFVAVDHDGNVVKLVDRLEFSRDNFATGQNRRNIKVADANGEVVAEGVLDTARRMAGTAAMATALAGTPAAHATDVDAKTRQRDAELGITHKIPGTDNVDIQFRNLRDTGTYIYDRSRGYLFIPDNTQQAVKITAENFNQELKKKRERSLVPILRHLQRMKPNPPV